MSGEFFSSNFPLDKTICKNCAYRFSRMIEPLDLEEYGLTEEVLNELGVEDDEEVIVEQHVCLVNYQDLDAIVKECSHFKEFNEVSFFKNPF
jgi:hypothetical protein